MKPINLISGFFTVGMWTMLSRILGFVRDVMISNILGPGILMDAYVAAFRLPNMFRRFFAEGAFNAAFVPMFSKRLEEGNNPLAFAALAFSGLALVLVVLTGLAMVFMPALIFATAEGFVGDARFDITVDFARITFPYVLFISLAALLSGVLNASGRFAAAAAAPVLLNVLLVGAMSVALALDRDVARALIWMIPFAGVAQLALVWIAADRAGLPVRFVRPRWTPEMSRLVTVAVPAALAGGVVQINLLVGQVVASQTEKAISWLYAADRLYQLPLGVVGIAVGIVLLPDLSRRLKARDDEGAREAFSRAGEIALALTLPCAVALVVISMPLVTVLFERGAFGSSDTTATALAVAIYGAGLPAFVLQKILQPVYFAREDTKRPFYFAVIAMVVNAGIAIGLAYLLGWIAAAIAATLAAWVMVGLLFAGMRSYGQVAQFDARFHDRIWRISIASLIMGGIIWYAAGYIAPIWAFGGWRWLALLGVILLGIAAYALAGRALGAFYFDELKQAFRRRKNHA